MTGWPWKSGKKGGFLLTRDNGQALRWLDSSSSFSPAWGWDIGGRPLKADLYSSIDTPIHLRLQISSERFNFFASVNPHALFQNVLAFQLKMQTSSRPHIPQSIERFLQLPCYRREAAGLSRPILSTLWLQGQCHHRHRSSGAEIIIWNFANWKGLSTLKEF